MAALDLPAAAADAFTGEVDVSEATIRPVIADSWRRCSRAGLDPLVRPPVPRPDPRAAATVTALDAELLDVSAPIMAEARELLARSNTIMILANRSGIVLGTEGDRATMDAAAEIRLTPGADWSEDARGTNGIGTALRTGGPIHIHAAEHYFASDKSWTCSAAVVRDPAVGDVLGAISVSGPSGAFNRHQLALAVASARRIESALIAREVHRGQRLLETGLGRISEGGSALPARKLRRVLEFIEANIDQPINLDRLASVAAVSRFHFHRQFKKATGSTPHQYVVQRRVERAKALLTESALPLIEIAARLGFTDQSHFINTFRKMTRVTPKIYRNRAP